MDWQSVIVGLILGLVVFFIVKSLISRKKRKNPCCGCSNEHLCYKRQQPVDCKKNIEKFDK